MDDGEGNLRVVGKVISILLAGFDVCEIELVTVTLQKRETSVPKLKPPRHLSVFRHLMDPSQVNTRECLRQAIDTEIKSLEPSLEPSIRALRSRRNALAPISSLPPEVFATIFALLRVRVLSVSVAYTLGGNPDRPDLLACLRVAHVCQQWREIALNQPLLWSHVDFTTFTSAGAAEILARAKEAPLHLQARLFTGHWNDDRISAFRKELQDRVSFICRLGIGADFFHLHRTLERLVSPAPTLEFLSLFSLERNRNRIGERVAIPGTLFNGSAPRLSWLELWNCSISWKSPLLAGLKHLEIRSPFERPSLSSWLDALEEMPQLKTLILHFASPITPPNTSLQSDIGRTVTLPYLTLFEISSPGRDCGLALAHLVLPALTSLCLILNSRHVDGDDLQDVLPFIARHAHGPQDTQPLHSVLFRNDKATEILAWILPDLDAKLLNGFSFFDDMHCARVAITVTSNYWSPRTHTRVFDAVMAALPLGSLVTLTAQNCTRPLDEQFWLRHAPRWPLLRRVRLWPSAARGFREMLEDKGGHQSPLLPLLKRLVLINIALYARRTLHLCDALRKRVEQRVPLETLDLRKCFRASRQVELLSDFVVEVLCPEATLETSAHGLHPEDSSGTEDQAEVEGDPGNDDGVGIW